MSHARSRLNVEETWPARAEIAANHALRREDDLAIDWLTRAHDAGYREYRILARDPTFGRLRGTPRFNKLLGLMESEVVTMRERSPDLKTLAAETSAGPIRQRQ